ncbi:MAG TPA: DUF5985 family protein [Thermoanaerobaculia bacterium]|jgi:hypothetical protein|nr:DUF5985 family protein [Thermoanaerobaculia bacterium]
MNFGTAVYIACAVLSAACAYLLLRGWARGRERLLLWSGLCFVGIAANNVLLFVDLRIMTQTDLSLVRMIPSAVGIAVLIFGLVWETR